MSDSLWVRGRATKAGAIVGSTVAGIASFGFFTTVCFTGSGCLATGPGNTPAAKWRAITTLTLAGAVGGGLLGAAVGSLIPKWRYLDSRRLKAANLTVSVGPGIAARVQF